MDVGVWLLSLGLGRYEVAFSDNSIEADVLPDLTDGDLAQLGVNLGDRKRLLKAIASLGAAYPRTKPTRPLPVIFVYGWCRAPPHHRDVLRSCRLDEFGREAGRRGLAQPRRHLSRRGFGVGDRAWRPCVEKARRWSDGVVRLSARARE